MKTSKTIATLLAIGMILGLGGVAQAASYTWDGGAGNALWSAGNNWNPDGTPVAGDILNVTGGVTSTADVSLLLGDYNITGAGNVTTVTGQLDQNGDPNCDGNSTMTIKNGGAVGFKGQSHFTNGYDTIIENGGKLWASDGQAHVNVRSGSTITLQDGAILDSGSNGFLLVEGTGTTVTMNGPNSWIRNGGEGGRTNVRSNGHLIVNDGKMDIFRYQHLKVDTGGLIEFNGGQLNTRDLMVGSTNQTGTLGTMQVTGDADLNLSGAISVGNTDITKAAGLLEITGGNATIDCATFALNATGTLSLLVDAGGISTINATGAATLDGLLDVDFTGAAAPGSWTVLDAASITDNGLAFDPSVDTDLSDGAGWAMTIDANAGTLAVDYTARQTGDGEIPEPATMALLGLAVCGLGGYVRRRKQA